MKHIPMKELLLGLILVMLPMAASAQSDRTFIRQGNRSYRTQKWTDAETMYRKALAKNPNNPQAVYNLGCTLLAQQKDSMAMDLFQKATQMENVPIRRAKSYHNMGVICQNHQQYAQAIQAYEMALRNNPHDNETRYNLVLCKKLLKNQKDNKKQNKNGNNKQDNNNNKSNKNNQNQNEQKKPNEQKQDKQQPKGQMSRENAEQLLNAAIQQEEATKQRMKKAARQPEHRQLEKNW